MYEIKTRYRMAGEPQLGYFEESELYVEDWEIDLLLARAFAENLEVPEYIYGIDEHNGEEIELKVSDWFDQEILDRLEDEEFVESVENLDEQEIEDIVFKILEDYRSNKKKK